MSITITDYFEQVDGLTVADVPPEVRKQLNDELEGLTAEFDGNQAGTIQEDPNTVLVRKDGTGDFETIQAAIDDDDTESGDTILIGPGTFDPDDQITVTNPGELRLIGNGNGNGSGDEATVIKQSVEVNVENADGNGVTFRNLRIEDVATGDPDGLDINATFEAAGPELESIALENVTIANNQDDGIVVDDAEQVSVRGCRIADNGGDGLLGRSLTNARIQDSEFVDNGEEGVDIDRAQNLSISGCRLNGNGSTGIEFDSPNGNGTNNVSITGTELVDNGGDGVEFNNGDVTNLSITGGRIAGNGVHGVEFAGNGSVDTFSVEGTTIVDNGADGFEFNAGGVTDLSVVDSTVSRNDSAGVEFQTDDGVDTFSLVDSRIADNGEDGLGVSTDLERLAVKRTTIENNGPLTFDNGAVGLLVSGTIVDAVIADSRIAGHFFGGVEFERAEALTIRDTVVEENGPGVSDPAFNDPVNGVEVNVTDLTVAGTTIRGNFGEGLNLRGGDIEGLTIRDSAVVENTSAGVRARGSDPLTAADVAVTDARIEGNDGDGLAFDTVDGLDITGSVIAGNGASGVTTADASSVSVTDTTVRGNEDAGLSFEGNVDGVRIERTVVRKNGNDRGASALFIDRAVGAVVVRKSNLVENGGFGIELLERSGPVTADQSYLANNGRAPTRGDITVVSQSTAPVGGIGAGSV
jgi:hypothetical protein